MFDYQKRVSSQGGALADYYVRQVKATSTGPTVVLRLRYQDYAKFASNLSKTVEVIQELVISKLPGLEFKGYNRKRIIMEQFKEIVSY